MTKKATTKRHKTATETHTTIKRSTIKLIPKKNRHTTTMKSCKTTTNHKGPVVL